MESELIIRLGGFLGAFLACALWERLAPRRPLSAGRRLRWLANLGVTLLNSMALRLLFPVLAVGSAAAAAARGWGLLNNYPLPGWLAVITSLVLLDFVIYVQHVLFHTLPLLWRLHMVHHADLDVDVTTGLRFHPLEIMLSMLIKIATVLLIGAPVLSVLVFEVVLNATSIFNHSNAAMRPALDRVLRLLVVTPDMHRVHHSVTIRETNSNFGFNLPWWDRIMGTYRPQPVAGHTGMTIGLAQFRPPQPQGLGWMLLLPFRGNPGAYAINQRGQEPRS
ncbi:MAG: sterol desaturase family protein [Thermodesulfobacteriota bacterium]